MDFLRILLEDTSWLTAVSAIAGSIITYLITKVNKDKDVSISDRKQLSKDQYQLIAELREMMQEQKDEIENLREEMKTLQGVNINLIIENEKLQGKIAELNSRLSRFDS